MFGVLSLLALCLSALPLTFKSRGLDSDWDRIKERAKPSVHRLLCNNNCPWRQADAPTSADSAKVHQI